MEITLPAEIVERTVLTGSRLSVSLSPDGRLVLDGEGLSHEVLEAASAAGGLSDQTLESLVSGCLNLDFLGGEDDPEAVDPPVDSHQGAVAADRIAGGCWLRRAAIEYLCGVDFADVIDTNKAIIPFHLALRYGTGDAVSLV